MKRKNLKLITLLSLLLSFVVTGGIFAYWASSVSGDSDATEIPITIGVGDEIETEVDWNEVSRTQGVLVPVGYEKSGSVSKIVIVYNVALVETETEDVALGDVVDFTVTINRGDLHDLVNVEVLAYSPVITVGGEAVQVTVEVTIDEPANREKYLEVAEQEFEFTVTFTTCSVE